jgi:hypothetical protein
MGRGCFLFDMGRLPKSEMRFGGALGKFGFND